MNTWGANSTRRMEGVDDRIIAVFDLALKYSPVDFGIAWRGGLRNAEQQHELFLSGKSTKDGYGKKSRHQYGEALDFIPYVKGQYLLPSVYHNKYYFLIIGSIHAAAAELNTPVRFGANWSGGEVWADPKSFIDLGHTELK